MFIHSVPDDVFFGELKEDHASTINEEWIHRDSTSYNYIRSLILLNGGLGIFEKSTKRLLSWITINDYFAFGWVIQINAIMCRTYFHTEFGTGAWQPSHRRGAEVWPNYLSKSMPNDLLRRNNSISLPTSNHIALVRWVYSTALDSKQLPKTRGCNWKINWFAEDPRKNCQKNIHFNVILFYLRKQ